MEFLAPIKHFSKVLQYDSITIDGMLRSFSATKERLGNLLTSINSSITGRLESLGEDLSYQGETLKVPRGYSNKSAVSSAVSQLMKKLFSEAVKALDSRFSTVGVNPVTQAMSFFSPHTWPRESSSLAGFGYDEVSLLSSHFSQPLQHAGYSPECCCEEWPELKMRARQILTKEPSVSYLPLWKRILEEYKDNPALTNILGLLRITLVIPVQTATLERGFSLMKRIKTDWRNRLSPQTLSQLMMIKLDGPGLDQFNPEPAIKRWWKEGPRSRRPGSSSQLVLESSDSEDDSD